jgi:4-amino-4-deoxy-L-arabinose transferase-like glycosyltransferase
MIRHTTLNKLTWKHWVVIGIVILGAFLRLYRIRETLMFQGDQGRDAIVVKRIIKDGDLTLLGPVTSVGNMYLGPFYYYFMAPWLWLTYPDPVGPAIGVAVANILFLALMYILGREMVGVRAAAIATGLMAANAIGVIHSRFSWNPNLAPLFGLVLFYCLFRVVKKRDYRYLIGAGLSMAGLLQLHYLTLLALPMIGMVIIWVFWKRPKDRTQIVLFKSVGFGLLLLSFLPLILFDLRHNHLIWNGFVGFFSGPEEHLRTVSRFWRIIQETEGRSFRILAQLMGSPNGVVDRLMVLGAIAGGLGIWIKGSLMRGQRVSMLLAAGFLVTAIIGSAVYSSTIFDHYLLFLLPSLALYYGLVMSRLSRIPGVGLPLMGVILGGFVWLNLPMMPTFKPAGTTIDDYRRVAGNISASRPPERYNVALLSENKDHKAMNYRYFLEVSDLPPLDHETYENLEALFVIDELGVGAPLEVPIYEISAAGMTRIENVYSLPYGVTVYKMGK